MTISDDIPDLTPEEEVKIDKVSVDEAQLIDLDDDKSDSAEEELVDSDGWIDVLGSGRIRAKIVSQSVIKEAVPIKIGNLVRLLLSAKFESTIVKPETELTVVAGDNDVVRALDLVLPVLHEGCTAVFITDPDFAYGKVGLIEAGIPPSAALEFSVSILSVSTSFCITSCDHDQRMVYGLAKKERGNFWFKRSDYSEAIHLYRRAVEYLDAEELDLDVAVDKSCLDPVLQLLVAERINVLNNLAQAQLMNDMLDAAFATVQRLLRTEPTNEKALYRKAKILDSKCSVDAAINCLRRLVQTYPSNEQAKCLLKRLIGKQETSRKREASMSRRMLGIPTDAEQRKSATRGGRFIIALKAAISRPSVWSSTAAVGLVCVAVLASSLVSFK